MMPVMRTFHSGVKARLTPTVSRLKDPLPYAPAMGKWMLWVRGRASPWALCVTCATYLWGTRFTGWSGVGLADGVATMSPARVKKR